MRQRSKKFAQDHQFLAEQVQAVIDELQQRVTERGYICSMGACRWAAGR
jgi:hypothetical protein